MVVKKKGPERPGYIPDSNSENVPESLLLDISAEAKKILTLQKQQEELEGEMKELSVLIQTGKQLLLDWMGMAGLTEFKLENGVKVRVQEMVSGSIIDGMALYSDLAKRKEESILTVGLSAAHLKEFREWYRKKVGRDLSTDDIAVSCHHKRLAAYIKERGDESIPGIQVKHASIVSVK